ncbi:MAG TPA: ABC transporter permease [Chloroflexota bacterium]|nr:ABC transporter permease [Chloroflexota bacterium]
MRYWLGNWKLTVGTALVLSLVVFSLVGMLSVGYDEVEVGAGPLKEAPSARYLLGTDNLGRNMLALMAYGIPPSLEIGLIAGLVGTVVGTVLGLASGYRRGWLDTFVRTVADITLTIPSLLILVVIASYFRTTTVELTALIVAIFAWAGPCRTIRAQTLSLRERAFVRVAKLSGRSDLEIILLELMPNLSPYIAAGLVGSVAGGILASVGIQLLGLGPLFTPNLGMILQFAFNGSALYQGMWWWWGPPAVALLILFVGLFLVSLALDEYANPRLRIRVA